MGWSNHYSPKFRQCFVHLGFLNGNAKTDREQPLVLYSLYDAFENREIATCADAKNALASAFCRVEDHPEKTTCADCRQFVGERMSQ